MMSKANTFTESFIQSTLGSPYPTEFLFSVATQQKHFGEWEVELKVFPSPQSSSDFEIKTVPVFGGYPYHKVRGRNQKQIDIVVSNCHSSSELEAYSSPFHLYPPTFLVDLKLHCKKGNNI